MAGLVFLEEATKLNDLMLRSGPPAGAAANPSNRRIHSAFSSPPLESHATFRRVANIWRAESHGMKHGPPPRCGLMKEENMKYLFAAALVATTVAGFGATANAAGGCGPGWYRGPYGGCQPMRRAVVVAPRPVVVAPRPVVVVPRARVCPYGTVWRAGRCRGVY